MVQYVILINNFKFSHRLFKQITQNKDNYTICLGKVSNVNIFKNKYVSRLYKNKKHPFFAAKIICRIYTLYHGMAERVNLKRLENIKNGINVNLDKEYPYTTKSSIFTYDVK